MSGALPAPATAAAVSAPIADVRYVVTFDAASAAERALRVATTFGVAGAEPVILSLPAWTPGAYDLTSFARWVTGFSAERGGQPLAWDKLDADTWRVWPGGAGEVTVRFTYTADTLDNAMAWAQPDFAFFNGTNVLLYPEGRPAEFAATLTVRTQPGWRVATGMRSAGAPNTYREASYHDVVDAPVFVGRFDLDSATVAGKTMRLATYPAGAMSAEARRRFWDDQRRMWPPMVAVFGDLPIETYTTLLVVDSTLGGGSALEHHNSHVGIYGAGLLDGVGFPSITAHEIFHLWNVKRLRPAEMVPYAYDRRQPTTLLWVSEGITDYYADLALVRGGVADTATFLALTQGKIAEVAASPPVALEDASLSTWIHPIENAYVYYPKGSLAGLLLDVLIRDASDGRGSLDTVMRDLYDRFARQGRGFTDADFWAAASRAAGGRSFAEEYRRYVDGREPYPWATVLPLAGLAVAADTLRVPVLGVFSTSDSTGTRVTQLVPGGVAERAGVRAGDELVRVGDVRTVAGQDFGAEFRAAYSDRAGAPLPIVVRRAGRTLTLDARVELAEQVVQRITLDPRASEKAVRVRTGILTGR
jgi:predicted metalloprotease with PDZ domain